MVPDVCEGLQGGFEVVWGAERFGEHLAPHDAEPDFDQVEPGAVERGEVDDDSLVISLQPLSPLRLGAQLFFRWAWNVAELRHELAKGITAVGREVVHHVVNGRGHGESLRMTFKNIEKGQCGVIGTTLDSDLSVRVMKEGEDIYGAVTDIFEFFEALPHGVGLQIGHQATQDLNAGAFVEKEQLFRWVMVEVDEVLHLWKEVGVCNMKEVVRQVWFQAMSLEDAMQGGLAGLSSHDVRLCLQMTDRPSQGPPSAARQRLGLTVKGNQPQLGFFRIDGRSSQTREIAEVPSGFTASNPASHGPYRALHEDADRLDRKAGSGQGNHCSAQARG